MLKKNQLGVKRRLRRRRIELKHFLLFPYRFWLRLDLHWIEDRIADEKERYARHADTMRSLRAEAAELRWRIGGRRPAGLAKSVWPKDRGVDHE